MPAKAVVIGCAAYDSPSVSRLRYPEKDAQELYRRLVDPAIGGYVESDVCLLTSPNYGDASRALARVFKSASRLDSVLFYFAGHGLRDDDGQIYLAVRDTDPELLEVTSMASQSFRQILDSCRSQKICVILDCCFSGAFGSRSVPSLRDVTKSLENLSGEGTIILTASQRTQEARERDEFGHGVFTNYLLNGIDGAADTNGDGIITALDLYNFVSHEMGTLGDAQKPTFSGSLAGGVFPLVRSGRRRSEALAQLRADIDRMLHDKQHLDAEGLLTKFVVSDQAEEKHVALLRDQVSGDKRALLEAFRRQLLQDAGNGDLSDGTLREVLDILKQHPDAIFAAKPSSAQHRLMRGHFIGRFNARTLDETWSPPEAVSQPEIENFAQPPPTSSLLPTATAPTVSADTISEPTPVLPAEPHRRRWRSVAVRVVIWLTAGLAVAAVFSYLRPPATLDPMHLRLGILLKREWQADTADAVFKSVIAQLNLRLQGIASFDAAVATFTDIKEVSRALRNRTVDVVGELSPRDIFVVQDLAQPFASGLYDGLQHYNALIFVPGGSPYLVAEDGAGEVKERSWDLLLTALHDGVGKLGVSEDSSTSGYWFPRSLVLEEFRQRNWFQSFADVSVRAPSQELMLSVACGRQKIIAGVVAAFRLPAGKQVMCDGQAVTLVAVQKSEGILHGGFAIRHEAARDERLVRALKNSWGNAVSTLPDPQRTALGLPAEWTAVNPAYYEPIRQVFAAPDPVEAKQSRDQKVALTAAALMLLACTLAYYFTSTRQTTGVGSKPNG